jgi:hypothetical protein
MTGPLISNDHKFLVGEANVKVYQAQLTPQGHNYSGRSGWMCIKPLTLALCLRSISKMIMECHDLANIECHPCRLTSNDDKQAQLVQVCLIIGQVENLTLDC